MKPISFDELSAFIHQFSGVSEKTIITPQTLFEKDLYISGDDGIDLLEAIESRFAVTFPAEEDDFRALFNLQPNEYLFHGEGFVFSLRAIFGKPTHSVRAFTGGELYEAICRLKA